MPRETFRRMLVGGYDPEQVDAAIDERDERLRLLEREAQKLAARVIETEKRLQRLLPGGGGEDGVIGAVGRRIEDIHAQARGQATRIRMAALQDAVQIADRVTQLAKVRDELGARVTELADMAGIKLGSEDRPPVGTEPAEAAADGVFAGAVEVEVGPLKDFAQLTNFEDAASRIKSAEDVRVSRFADGRATFSMNFAQPVELLRELEERAPFEFRVRDMRGDGLVLDVDGDGPGAPEEPEGENRAA